jgi:DNA-binding CsgD family transcriptional regulator
MAPPGKTDTVRFSELERAMRLAVELRELPRGSELQKRHFLDGMIELIGAKVGIWARTEGVILRRELDFGWACDAERQQFLEYCDSAQWRSLDPTMPALARQVPTPTSVFVREQLVDDRGWYRSEHVQRFRREARVDSFLYGVYAPTRDIAIGFSLHRDWGDRAFSERERRLADAIHRACAFIHQVPAELPPAVMRGLSPRLRTTLGHLARGLSEKQVAAELELSPHTVHDYVKALYRHFGVQSRSELLARCLGSPPSPSTH